MSHCSEGRCCRRGGTVRRCCCCLCWSRPACYLHWADCSHCWHCSNRRLAWPAGWPATSMLALVAVADYSAAVDEDWRPSSLSVLLLVPDRMSCCYNRLCRRPLTSRRRPENPGQTVRHRTTRQSAALQRRWIAAGRWTNRLVVVAAGSHRLPPRDLRLPLFRSREKYRIR